MKDTCEFRMDRKIKLFTPESEAIFQPPVVKNPFKCYMKLNGLEILRIFFFSWLVLLRLVLLLFTALVTLIWSSFFLIGYKETSPPTPFKGFRKVGFDGMYVLSRFNCFICGFHRIKVIGKISPEARVLVVAPHSCIFDIWLVSCITKLTSIGKSEFRSVPLLSNIIRMIQPIYVSRSDRESTSSSRKEIERRVRERDWPPLVVFPEGTCTNRLGYISFKSGAFVPGVPVQSVIIRYPGNEAGGFLDYATWGYIGPSLALTVPLMLSRPTNQVEMEILPVYNPSSEELNDPTLYAENVRNFIARNDNRPTTEHSYEDCRLMESAATLGLPMETGLVEFRKLHRELEMNFDEVQEKLKQFSEINSKSDGRIVIKEFCQHLNLPLGEETSSIFSLYDINKDNVIDFREYLIATCLVKKRFLCAENIKSAFAVLSNAVNGCVTKSCVKEVLFNNVDASEEVCTSFWDNIVARENGQVFYEDFVSFCQRKPDFLLYLHFRTLIDLY